jgi:cellulose synthase/poly-beta-1,6-N-acetylglucosamine synthase-like glycosyltransferase
MLTALFWIAVLGVVYVYAGYPLLLWLWNRRRPRPVSRGPHLPTVSVVIAARNEETAIGPKLANTLALEYPPSRLEVIVVSDGSTDRTEELVKSVADDRVTLIALLEHRGKAEALNAGVSAARGEIVVFADARQRFDRSALRALVASFGDPAVGAVSGELHLGAEGAGPARFVGLYWTYEKLLRRLESGVDSTLGATGAIYAIRRSLFRPLTPGTILDDFVIPMRIVAAGYRTVFEPAARAHDLAAERVSDEFSRKVRTLAGNYQAFRLCPGLFRPSRNRVFIQFVSHKVGRLVVPFLLAVTVLTSGLLPGAFYRLVFWSQVAFYGLGVAAPVVVAVANFARVFLVLNLAAVVGLVHHATGRIPWTRTSTAGASSLEGAGDLR